MSAGDTIVFRDFDPVTGRPTIDGFATADAGIITTEAEPGYVNGARVALDNGANNSGVGLPPVVVQTIRDGDTLVIGIMCRGDTSFDDGDGVVIGLRQNGSSITGPQRRIDIFPVWGNAPSPLDPSNLGLGFGAVINPAAPNVAELADNPPKPSGTPSTNDIRTNKPAFLGPTYYQRANDSGNWTSYLPMNVGDTAKYHIKVRSWQPGVVSGFEAAWSIEVRIPVDVATGGPDWINLGDDFGLFVDVIRTFRVAENNSSGVLVGKYKRHQSKFPFGASDLTGILGITTDIPSGSFGHGYKGAMVANGEGVRIKPGLASIGRRPGNPLGSNISRVVDNQIVALIENTGPAASGIRATVRMANWGLGSGDLSFWNPAPGCDNPTLLPVALAPGTPGIPTSGETVNNWPAIAVPAAYDPTHMPDHSHQCMWIQLDSTTPGVNFTQSSARRNMDFVNMSEVVREPEVSGKGYPKPIDGTDKHDFILFTRCRKIEVRELLKNKGNFDTETIDLVGGALRAAPDVPNPNDQHNVAGRMVAVNRGDETQWMDSVVYLWITEGFRRTGNYLTIHGVPGELLDGSPGEFGLIAHHKGVDDNLCWEFSGDGLSQYGPGIYGLKVPHDDVTSIKLRVSAEADGPLGDVSRNLPKPEVKGGGDDIGDPDPDPKPPKPDDGKNGLCGLIALGIIGVPLVWAASQLVA
jgi:hypothetical protein